MSRLRVQPAARFIAAVGRWCWSPCWRDPPASPVRGDNGAGRPEPISEEFRPGMSGLPRTIGRTCLASQFRQKSGLVRLAHWLTRVQSYPVYNPVLLDHAASCRSFVCLKGDFSRGLALFDRKYRPRLTLTMKPVVLMCDDAISQLVRYRIAQFLTLTQEVDEPSKLRSRLNVPCFSNSHWPRRRVDLPDADPCRVAQEFAH